MMATETKSKILVLLDGSDHAFEAVRYLNWLEPFRNRQVVLFSVLTKIPEAYWDIEKQPKYEQSMKNIHAWQTTREMKLTKYMDEARRQLLDSGFPENAVEVKIQERRTGIGRDILEEARKGGYSAVVVGRKGAGRVRGLVLGSVTTKLLERLDFVPIFVVGRCPATHKILVALDGSDSSVRAVDYVCETLEGCDCDVTLVHVVRSEREDFVERAEKKIAPVFELAKSHLANWGFNPRRIKTRLITGAVSRAGSIVREAEEGNYCTIVVGRRGLSEPGIYFMGRVSNKIVQLAKKQVVWVVT
jgi:nucleotide-binding universal stress UspA family protein